MQLADAIARASAINRSGTRPIRVMYAFTSTPVRNTEAFTVIEIVNDSPVDGQVRTLGEFPSVAAVHEFLDQQGYSLDPNAWNEG